MIGIIGAMESEVMGIIALMENTEEKTISGIKFTTGTIHKKQVVTAISGIGKVFAAMCAQTMILEFKADFIVHQGVAGSLSDNLNVFDIAVAKSLVQHDMDTTAIGDEIGLISGINIVNLPCDEKMVETAVKVIKDLGLNLETGVIASGDQFVASKEKKDEIKKNFGAIACEMEGGAVAQVCYVNKVPCLVIRAISDSADGKATVDYPEFVKQAAKNSIKVLDNLIKSI